MHETPAGAGTPESPRIPRAPESPGVTRFLAGLEVGDAEQLSTTGISLEPVIEDKRGR